MFGSLITSIAVPVVKVNVAEQLSIIRANGKYGIVE